MAQNRFVSITSPGKEKKTIKRATEVQRVKHSLAFGDIQNETTQLYHLIYSLFKLRFIERFTLKHHHTINILKRHLAK